MKPMTFKALALVALVALPACGGKSKEAYDTIAGNRQHDTPFKIDTAQLPGTYVQTSTTAPVLWKFTDKTVEVYRSGDGAHNCPLVRPYHAEGDHIVATSVSAACPALSVGVYLQAPTGSANLGLDSEGTKLTRVDDAGLRDALYAFDIYPEAMPDDLKSILPTEPSDQAITDARAAFRTAFTGATLQLTRSVASLLTPPGSLPPSSDLALYKVVGFKDGKAFTPKADMKFDDLGIAAPNSGVTCYLWTSEQNSNGFAGFTSRVAGVRVSHSRRAKGMWYLSQNPPQSTGATAAAGDQSQNESEKVNFQRLNNLFVTLESAPVDASTANSAPLQKLDLECAKPRGTDVLTLSDVKAALGDSFTISQ